MGQETKEYKVISENLTSDVAGASIVAGLIVDFGVIFALDSVHVEPSRL